MKENIGFLIISHGWSGAENALYNILVNATKINPNITLFVNDEIFHYYSNIKNLNICKLGKMYQKGKMYQLYNHFKFSRVLLKNIKDNQIKLMNLFLESSIITYYLIYKKINIPFIISLRGTEIDLYNNRTFFTYIRYFHILVPFIRLLKYSKFIHSNSSGQISKLYSNLKSKVVIINNGVDTKLFRKIKTNKADKMVLFVGRYLDSKGINELLSVARECPDYNFCFVGKGPLSNIISGKNIENIGFLSPSSLVKIYNKSTICTFPSYHEGFPNVGLEAMACGKAIIATPQGFSEYIENGQDGIIIPPKDSKSLKKWIIRLMEDFKLRQKLARNSRKKSMRYSWKIIATNYMNLCNRALNL